ncbi:MAG: hypothetical protein RI567_02285 [Marinobacter sp.]|nr:hypothetical protein [Marinobacter sp.]
MAEKWVESVLAGEMEFDSVFKDTPKCLVARFDHPELGPCVLKVPRARSGRRWERFLTLFRAGEAIRQFKNMEMLLELGLQGPTPVLAAEKRQNGVVVDSFYVYSFVEGREGEVKDRPAIINALLPLYEKRYCRADPKVGNHILNGNSVYLIDFRIKRPILFGSLRCAMEFCQLAGSQQLAMDIGRRAGYQPLTVRLAWWTQRASQRLRKAKQALLQKFRHERRA